MPRRRDELPAIRVYTVCDESRYLIVRNVPALGCGDDLLKLFSSCGNVEECKPMDGEECEQFTDVYWIKFRLGSNARIAKRKLDGHSFLGNPLEVSYAPQYESLLDTKDKLEGRRKEVLARLYPGRYKGSASNSKVSMVEASLDGAPHSQNNSILQLHSERRWDPVESTLRPHISDSTITRISSNQDYFPSDSMNQTVHLVREKLDKIQSSGKHIESQPDLKKAKVDNRRRI